MINLMLGTPGGGKSYEVVVFHILPALISGRMVITNLPVNIEEFEKIEPGTSRLLTVIRESKEKPRPFSTVEDYGIEWRGEDGKGPLYVIDESHKAIPRGGVGKRAVPEDLEEWFAEHRHEGADVLLITQSYRKINAAVVDMVQVVYRVRKNVALGSMNSYTRKVQDGVRGAVVNETIRKYKKQYFRLYKSHTKTDAAVMEQMTQDIKPIWSHWSVKGAVVFLLVGAFMLYKAGSPFTVDVNKLEEKKNPEITPQNKPIPAVYKMESKPEATKAPDAPIEAIKPKTINHPYAGYGIHVLGYLASSSVTLYQFGVSQNGQLIFQQSDKELTRAGYEIEPLNDCAVRLTYKEFTQIVLCDAPSVSVARNIRGGNAVRVHEKDVPVTRLSEQQ